MPANESPALTKSMSMDIWVVGISNQLFIRDSYSYSQTKFKKNKVKTKSSVFCDRPNLYFPLYLS